MRRLFTLLVGAAVTVGGLSVASRAEAQEIQLTGPLAGAPAVRKMRHYRKGRVEFAPTFSFTLLDEYRRTMLPGARIQYGIFDWLSIGGWGGFGLISTTTDLTDQVDAVAPRNSRTATNIAAASGGFEKQTAKMQWVGAPQLQFAPFRGKLALFEKIFVDTDAYLHGGVAFIGLQERGDCGAPGQPACSDQRSFELQSRTAVAPTFGLGMNFYLNQLVSLGLEYRALPFSWNRAGFDSRGAGNDNKFPDNKIDSSDQTFKFNQMVTIAIGFSFPKPKISE